MNIALCIYGPEIVSYGKLYSDFADAYPEHTVTLFRDINENKLQSLWRVSTVKRNYEIEHQIEFDLCVGVYSLDTSLAHCKIPHDIVQDTLYFTNGYFDQSRFSTGVSMSCFFCRSYEFDRVSEFIHNVANIRIHLPDEESRFYFHIKSLMYRTECVNREDATLFKIDNHH